MTYDLVISGEIGSYWSSVSVDYVRYTLSKKKDSEVHVGFCSLGGSVKDGLEICQAFKDHGNVIAHAFGMNASISTIAMLGCKKIDIVKNSFFLIHNTSTLIYKWNMSNKEQIDAIMAELKKTRNELETFDDVLAEMYVEKTGKTVDEVKKQMNKGNWMSAKQALDFGLVDEIREDKEDEKKASQLSNLYTKQYHNSIYQDAGMPPLPTDDGNPTPGFLRKTLDGLQALLQNKKAENKTEDSMIKVFNLIAALLAVKDGFQPQDDGSIALTQEQMKTIENKLAQDAKTLTENAAAMKTAGEAVEKLKADKANLESEIKELKAQVETLKGAPAVPNNSEQPTQGAESFSAKELFNIIQDI